MTKRELTLKRISERLSSYVTYIRIISKNTYYDAAKDAEKSFMLLLNVVYDWNLVNANAEVLNVAGIDLIDRTRNLIIQVSISAKNEKIKDTQEQIQKQSPLYDNFTLKYLFIVESYKPQADAEVIDLTRLMRDIDALSDEKLKEVDYLASQYFAFSESDETKIADLTKLETKIDELSGQIQQLPKVPNIKNVPQKCRDKREWYIKEIIDNNGFQSHRIGEIRTLYVEPRLLPYGDKADTKGLSAIKYFHQIIEKDNRDNRLFLVVGGPYMGKTTFMVQLCLHYIMKNFNDEGISPQILLYRLDTNKILETLARTEDPHNTILLLDALDSNKEATTDFESFKEKLETIIEPFRMVVIACRTQFFDQERKMPVETSWVSSKVSQEYIRYECFEIAPFSEEEINKYLWKKFPIAFWKRKAAKKIVSKCENLMTRPFLLSNIETLLQNKDKEYRYVSDIYRQLINQWVQNEVNTIKGNRDVFKAKLYDFYADMAMSIYQKWSVNGSLYLDTDQMMELLSKNGINDPKNERIRKSLIVSNNGEYSFAHDSFLEYFIAYNYFDGKESSTEIFSFGIVKQFYESMCQSEMDERVRLGKYALSKVTETEEDEHLVIYNTDGLNSNHLATALELKQIRPALISFDWNICTTALLNLLEGIEHPFYIDLYGSQGNKNFHLKNWNLKGVFYIGYDEKKCYYPEQKYNSSNIEILKRILEQRKASEQKDEEMIAESCHDLGLLYQYLGEKDLALKNYEEALTIQERILGSEHKDTATTYNCIGTLYLIKENYPQAKSFFEKALNTRVRVLGFDHLDTAVSYSNLGQAYEGLEKYNEALKNYKDALDIRLRVIGTYDPLIAASYDTIGLVYKKQKKLVKALEYSDQASAIRNRGIDKIDLEIAYFYRDYARWFRKNHDYSHALGLYIKALELFEKVLGTEHPVTATTYNNIGMVYESMDEYPKALKYLEKALTVFEKVFGTKHTNTASIYINIGGVYESMGEYPKVLEYYEKALAIREKVLGTEHPDTATSYNDIGGVYKTMEEYSKALEYFEKALAIRKKALGAEHPKIVSLYHVIGEVYIKMSNLTTALEYYEKELAIRKRIFGPESIRIAHSYKKIGMVCSNHGYYPTALEYYEKELAILKQKHEPNESLIESAKDRIEFVKSKISGEDYERLKIEDILPKGFENAVKDTGDFFIDTLTTMVVERIKTTLPT